MNERTETLKLILSGDGKLLGTELGRGEQHIKRYTGRVQGYFGKMNQAIGRRLQRMVTSPLAIIGGAAGIAYAAKKVVDYQDKLSTMGINAGLTARQLMMLDQAIYKNAYTTGQSRDQILAAMIDIYDKTGDFKFVEESIAGVAKSTTAMSAEMLDSGRILSAMRLGMGATAEDAEQLFDIMARMGNIGSFPFAQQAQQAERLFASSTLALGISKKNFAEYAAFIQSVKPLFGTADIAATAIEQIMMKMAVNKKAIEKAVGFKLFDEKGAIKDFHKTILALSKVDVTKRQKLFGEFSRAFIPLSSKEGIAMYERYIEEGTRAGFITEAFAKKQAEAKFQMNALGTAAQQFADVGLTPIIKDLTKALNEMTSDPDKMKAFRGDIVAIAGALGMMAKATGKVATGWGRIFGAGRYLWDKAGEGEKYSTYRMREDFIKSSKYSPDVKNAMLNRLENEKPFVLPKKNESMQNYLNRADDNKSISVASPSVKNDINLSISLPDSGPVVVTSDDSNTTVSVKKNRGAF
jgi:TP901 family phage tail tape measure protein